MDDRSVPKIRRTDSVPVRILVRVTDFWYEIRWYGTWYAFSDRIFIGTVRGTNFGTGSNLVRYVVRIIRTVTDFCTEFRTTFRTNKNAYQNAFHVPFRTDS